VRISSTPALYADSNFSVLDLNWVGAQLDREVELVLSRANVVLPPVPGARQDATLEASVSEWPLEMEAMPLHGEEAVVAVRQRDLLLAGADCAHRSGRNVFDPGDGDGPVLHVGDTNRG
jgi:hypothetical protein